MKKFLKEINSNINDGNFAKAQDLLRESLFKMPDDEILSIQYIAKSYQLANPSGNRFGGVSSQQLNAYALVVRQILIENSEEFDRRVSRVVQGD